jgi:hypothetical protein
MSDAELLHVVLWGVQGFLALFFLAAGTPKIFGRGIDKWTGFSELPRSQVVVIGVAEVLGAVALVLPMVSGIGVWLTPLAAAGLAVIVLMATGFHVRGAEALNAVETGLWAAIAAGVAVGRWDLVASSGFDASPWLLIAILGILVPLTIVNIVVLWRRPVQGAPAADARPVTRVGVAHGHAAGEVTTGAPRVGAQHDHLSNPSRP